MPTVTIVVTINNQMLTGSDENDCSEHQMLRDSILKTGARIQLNPNDNFNWRVVMAANTEQELANMKKWVIAVLDENLQNHLILSYMEIHSDPQLDRKKRARRKPREVVR